MVDELAPGNGCDRGQDRVPGEQRRPQGGVARRSPTSRSRSATCTWRTSPPARAPCGALSPPWRRGSRAAQTPQAIGCEKKTVRISTCFLIDDYFSRFSSPADGDPDGAVRGRERRAADRLPGARVGLRGRRAARARPSLTLGSLVTEPVPGTTGGRPPLTETGWLTNGQRSPTTSRGEAMAKRSPVAAAAGERAPTALDLRRRRTLGRARGAADLVLPDARRRLAVDAAGAPARPGTARS